MHMQLWLYRTWYVAFCIIALPVYTPTYHTCIAQWIGVWASLRRAILTWLLSPLKGTLCPSFIPLSMCTCKQPEQQHIHNTTERTGQAIHGHFTSKYMYRLDFCLWWTVHPTVLSTVHFAYIHVHAAVIVFESWSGILAISFFITTQLQSVWLLLPYMYISVLETWGCVSTTQCACANYEPTYWKFSLCEVEPFLKTRHKFIQIQHCKTLSFLSNHTNRVKPTHSPIPEHTNTTVVMEVIRTTPFNDTM